MAIEAGTMSRGLLPFPRKVIVTTIVILAAYDVAWVFRWLSRSPQPPFDDFFGLWSFGKFAMAAGPAVYDPVALQKFQQSLDPAFHGAYPYPYPPTFLLALLPLGLIPLAFAYILWIAATFALYTLATLGRNWRSLSGAALLVAPTTLLTIISGQSGLLSAALLVGGLRSLKRFPAITGVLFGLLTYKPQLGLLIPIVLLAARKWEAIMAACLTAVFVMVASSTVFGWSIWPTWVRSTSLYHYLLQANQSSFIHAMPTVVASMREVGASELTAYSAQLIITTVIAIIIWRMIAYSLDERSIAAAVVATILATPYAFIYDMPMITAALVIYGQQCQRLGIPIKIWEVVVVIFMFAVIIGMISFTIPFAAPLLLSLIFGTMVISNNPRRSGRKLAQSI